MTPPRAVRSVVAALAPRRWARGIDVAVAVLVREELVRLGAGRLAVIAPRSRLSQAQRAAARAVPDTATIK